MSLLQISNVKKMYADKVILDGVDAKVFKESRIGLIGANGTGKSTLFKTILGQLELDGGEVIRHSGLKIYYLSQVPQLDLKATVLEEALKSFSDLQQMEQKLEDLQNQMGQTEGDELNQLIEEYDTLMAKFEDAGGYRYHGRAESVLIALGFPKEMFNREVGKLSGGQKNRLALARILLIEADLILLDEPTNFLDIQTIEWLEEELKQKNSAYVIISHDRYFLNNIALEIWELISGKVQIYKGNYDQYETIKEQLLENLQKQYDQQQAEIKRQEDFIRRNIYGQKTKQAQSRRKMLQKLDRIETPIHDNKKMKIDISSEGSGSSIVLETRNLGHSYGDTEIFSDLTVSLYAQEKMAVIGPNGCGKSTFLHIVMGKMAPSKGIFHLGQKNKVGFYHQELIDLNLEETVFESIKNIVPTMDDGPLRGFLARFLFSGDEIEKQVGSLSGGEKSKLALARLIIQRPNFLILDEPTNHLDIASCNALEEALSDYDGTILFTSHDRYFINQIATRLLIFHDKKWINFHGSYDLFQSSKSEIIPEEKIAEKKQEVYQKHQVRQKPKKVKKRYTLEELEEKIISTETRLQELLDTMALPEVCKDQQKTKLLKEEYDNLNQELASLNEEWETWE